MSCPCFIAIKEGGNNNCLVYFDFGCLRNVFPIPHIPVESAKGCSYFHKSGIYLVIHDDRLREGIAGVGQLFYQLQSSLLDGDVEFNV